jgi:hypothetical protein
VQWNQQRELGTPNKLHGGVDRAGDFTGFGQQQLLPGHTRGAADCRARHADLPLQWDSIAGMESQAGRRGCTQRARAQLCRRDGPGILVRSYSGSDIRQRVPRGNSGKPEPAKSARAEGTGHPYRRQRYKLPPKVVRFRPNEGFEILLAINAE